MIIDTHAHLTDESLIDQVPQLLSDAAAVDVRGILVVATDVRTSQACIQLSERHRELRASVGIHPNYSCQANSGDWELIESLAKHERVVAVGETGLDRYWKDCAWEIQVEMFRKHIRLSRQVNLPLVIQTRECSAEMLRFLQAESAGGSLRGVMHSFTGSPDVARGCIELGLYISFAGMVTYKNADDIREVASQIPDDRLLVETDCPYLTPHPFRGQRPNKPALVVHTLQTIAEVRQVSRELLAAQTTINAQRLFGAWR